MNPELTDRYHRRIGSYQVMDAFLYAERKEAPYYKNHPEKIGEILRDAEPCYLERCWDCWEADHLTPMPILRPGETVLLTAGSYSDYGVVAILRVLQEFDPDGRDLQDYGALVAEGLVEVLPYHEVLHA